MTPEDLIPPVIVGVGPSGFFECTESPLFSAPTASDNCSTASISFIDEPATSGCAGSGVRRIWMATDECGNTSTASQTMLVDDSMPPVITGVGLDGNFACGEDPVFSTPTAFDNCSSATLTFSDQPSGSGCAGTGIVRTWTATDACGNTSTASQTMVTNDTTPPVISGVLPDGSYACGETPVFSSPTASDDCSTATLTFVDEPLNGDCSGTGIKRTWIATDACGNTSTASQSLITEDLTPPIISGVEADGSFPCGENPVFSDPVSLR